MKWWFSLSLKVRTALVGAIGYAYAYAWLWILLGALAVPDKSPHYRAAIFLGNLFVAFLYPWAFGGTLCAGLGMGIFFALVYLRKRLFVLSWSAISLGVGLWFTQKELGQLPSLTELIAIAEYWGSVEGFIILGIFGALFFSLLLYWLVTPLPALNKSQQMGSNGSI